VVGIAGIIALIMYVQIQLTALSLVFRLALGSALPAAWASSLAALLMLLFVYLAGLRSAAFAAGIKDVLMLVLVVILGGTVAAKVGADSMLDVFQRVQQLHPNIGHFPGLDAAAGLDTTWFVTAALNVALGTWIFPHMFQLCFAARDADTIRRNAIWQPLYSLSYFFIILLGFAAHSKGHILSLQKSLCSSKGVIVPLASLRLRAPIQKDIDLAGATETHLDSLLLPVYHSVQNDVILSPVHPRSRLVRCRSATLFLCQPLLKIINLLNERFHRQVLLLFSLRNGSQQ
jgi:hypothetical protein